MIAWDTETRNLRWWERPAFLASWDEGDGGKAAPILYGEQQNQFIDVLEQHDEHVLANVKFDAHNLRTITRGWDLYKHTTPDKIHDVIMQSRLLNGNRRNQHGLDQLSADYLGPEAMEGETAMETRYLALKGRESMKYDDAYWDVWNDAPELVERYARDDATHTRQIDGILRPQIEADPKLNELYRLEQRVTEVLYRAEERGVRIDQAAVSRLDTHYREREVAARHNLETTLGFVPEGTGSRERLAEALIDAGCNLTEKNKDGSYKLDKPVLRKFEAEVPAIQHLFEFRRVEKFQSTYLDALRDLEVVHPTFNQAQAWTGRMSGSNPNTQNIPKRSEIATDADLKVRSVFVPRPGMEFMIFDYDSIEMRGLAHFIGIPEYQDEIDNGDPHAKTAFAAMGVLGLTEGLTYEDFGKSTPNRGIRDGAKQVTYSIVYGGGGPVVCDTWNREMAKVGRSDLFIDLDQARQVRKAITRSIPGFGALADSPWKGKKYPSGSIHQQLMRSMEFVNGEAYGYIRTIGGRMQWIKLEKAYVGLSGLIQGSAADIMKAGSVNVFDALKGTGAMPLLFVHDELVIECEKGQGKDLYPIVEDAMCSAYEINPRLRVEGHITEKSYAHAD